MCNIEWDASLWKWAYEQSVLVQGIFLQNMPKKAMNKHLRKIVKIMQKYTIRSQAAKF